MKDLKAICFIIGIVVGAVIAIGGFYAVIHPDLIATFFPGHAISGD